MITSEITLQGFKVGVSDGSINELDNEGKETGNKTPVKVLQFNDHNGGSVIRAVFLPEQFEAFVEQLHQSTNRIVSGAPFLNAVRNKLPWSRNGKIRG